MRPEWLGVELMAGFAAGSTQGRRRATGAGSAGGIPRLQRFRGLYGAHSEGKIPDPARKRGFWPGSGWNRQRAEHRATALQGAEGLSGRDRGRSRA